MSAHVSKTIDSPFLLIVSREGREEFVKNEMATRFLGAKFSFSRPGFISFKQADAVSAGQKNWKWSATENLVFPLRTAFFVGKWVVEKGFSLASTIPLSALRPALLENGKLHFHALDMTPVGKDDEFVRSITSIDFEARYSGCLEAASAGMLAAIEAESSDSIQITELPWNQIASTGDAILQAFAVSETEVWFGWSLLRAGEFGNPGGESGIEKAESAPSRAYLKFVEAAMLLERQAGKPIFKADDRAIEVGAAPGGACYGLLERGLKVTGVDRGAIDPAVLRNAKFTRVDSSIGDWMFPESVMAEWLLIDMNAEARIAMRECKPLTDYIKRGLKGVFFTLKLNQVEYALSTERLAKTTAQDLGLHLFFVRQLPSNHQEVALFGLTKKGLGMKTVSSR